MSSLQLSALCSFWFGVKSRGTHLADTLDMWRWSCRIVSMEPKLIFVMAANCLTVTRRSSSPSVLTWQTLSSVTTKFGRPSRGLSWIDGKKSWFELSHPVFDRFIGRAFFLVITKHLLKNYRRLSLHIEKFNHWTIFQGFHLWHCFEMKRTFFTHSTTARWKGHSSLIQQLLSRKVLSSAHLSLDIPETSHAAFSNNTFWALQVLLLYHQSFIVRVKTYWTPLVIISPADTLPRDKRGGREGRTKSEQLYDKKNEKCYIHNFHFS